MTQQTVAETLDKAADHIRQHGHHKGAGFANNGAPYTVAACSLGALTIAADQDRRLFDAAVDALRNHVGTFIVGWNDAPERTADEVIEALRAAAIIAAAQETDVRVVAPEAELTAVSLAEVAGAVTV